MKPRIPYWPLLLGPTFSFCFGIALNKICIAVNGGLMPVLAPDCVNPLDETHACMTAATHLKFLADWVVLKGIGTASIGDGFIYLNDLTFVPALVAWAAIMIIQHNRQKEKLDRNPYL